VFFLIELFIFIDTHLTCESTQIRLSYVIFFICNKRMIVNLRPANSLFWIDCEALSDKIF
jgi:hypothetical protein